MGYRHELQQVQRDNDELIQDEMLQLLEMTKADEFELRSRTVEHMSRNIQDYDELNTDVINADLPPWLRYNTILDRLYAMLQSNTMAGELEIIAPSQVLQRPISPNSS